MTPTEYLTDVIPAAMALLPTRMDTQESRAMLIAIALQESRLTYRKQIGGPARGFHQFETGGVRAVLRHTAVDGYARSVVDALGYPPCDPMVMSDVARLHAAFTGRRVEWSASAVRGVLRRFPLMTLQVIAGIHWEAFKLWRKGLRYYPNPHAGEVPPHG